MRMTAKQYQEYIQGAGNSSQRPRKYRNKPSWYDGIHFDSLAEITYYKALKGLLRFGDIAGFIYHGKMVVTEGTDQDNRATTYEPDFVVIENDQRCRVVDVKGVETDVFKIKLKALKNRYPKVVIELVKC